MATMPGMNADVFWGDPSKPPPNWRDHPIPDAGEDDDEYSEDATPERRKWVYGVSGIDPAKMGWDEVNDESDDEGEANESD